MSFTERLKDRGRRFSNAVRGSPDPNNLNLGDLLFDPTLSLPTSESPTSDSSTSSSRECTLSHHPPLRRGLTEYQTDLYEQRVIPPPILTRNPERLRHRRRDTSPGRSPPDSLWHLLQRSASDPRSFEFEHNFLPPIPEGGSPHWQPRPTSPVPTGTVQEHFRSNGPSVASATAESGQTSLSLKRGQSLQYHQRLETSAAQRRQNSLRDSREAVRRSASVPKSYRSTQYTKTTNVELHCNIHQILSPSDTAKPSKTFPRLLASSVFDSSTGSSSFSFTPQDLIHSTNHRSLDLHKAPRMAAMRASTFLGPYPARLSRLPESQRFTRNEARKQQAAIHARLKSAGKSIPPYEFLNFIGKGSYGRVYLA